MQKEARPRPAGRATRRDELAALEGVIERGLDTFAEVGRALREIQDRRLYRELGYVSFTAYAEERWASGSPEPPTAS